MKTVVVGGHTRNIGKTSVMAGLIRNLKSFDWAAVKITQYGHGICSRDGEPCGCAPTGHAFVLTEEADAAGNADSCRLLAAGARRSLWLRVREGQLAAAIPLLERALAEDDSVMIESNSILEFLKPSLYLVVLDTLHRDFKRSALNFLHRADALVSIESRFEWDASTWPAVDPRVLQSKPRFPVPPGVYHSAELCQFVRQELCPVQVTNPNAAATHPWREKEQPCQH